MKATVPEAPETIEAQLEWLKAGKRRAVLLTPGCVLPELPENTDCVPTKLGIVVFDFRHLSRIEVFGHVNAGTIGEMLGYGIEDKPEGEAEHCVTVRGPNGFEKQAVVTDSKRLDNVLAAANQIKDPQDTVQVENPSRVLRERLEALSDRELKIRPFTEVDEGPLRDVAHSDGHAPLFPTHVICRGGDIVGSIGINSLPLFRIWFHSARMTAADSKQLLSAIEKHYAFGGVQLVASIVPTDSPFYPIAARFGYLEVPEHRIFLKRI